MRTTAAVRRWLLNCLAVLAFGIIAPCAAARADGEMVLVGPMSGPYATTGAAMQEAVDALSSGSASLSVHDDRCQADGALVAAQRIAALKPAIVIGHPCSSSAIAAAPIYAAAQIPFISTGARHGDLTDKRAGPLVFRLSGRDDREGAAAAAFLARASGGRAIAVLHDRTFAMSTIAADTVAALTGPGGTPPAHKVMLFPFVASELNYDALIAKVLAFSGAADQVGAVLFAGYPAEAVIVLRALRARGIKAPLLGVNAMAKDDFGQFLQPNRGIAIGRGSRPASETEDTSENGFDNGDGEYGEVRVLASTDAFGPHATGARTAAAIGIWREISELHPANPGAALADVTFDDPALGPITFDAKGDAVIPSYLVCAWRDGAWKPVAARGAEQTPPP